MNNILLKNWIFHILVICLITIAYSCQTKRNTNNIKGPKIDQQVDALLDDRIDELAVKIDLTFDTLIAHNSGDLIKYIRSNRIINLKNMAYNLDTTLSLDGIENLSIIGKDSSKLMINTDNTTVVHMVNSSSISLNNLEIGNSNSLRFKGQNGKLRFEYSNDITISNCKILGYGTSGLSTHNTHNLIFADSEILASDFLIFELVNSSNFEFINSTFHDNNFLVLGAFTDSTKAVSFLNCEFYDNYPSDKGNPAFNFLGNWYNFEEKVLFSSCTFKNNIGFKWYGDKIILDNCKLDSSGFIGLENMR